MVQESYPKACKKAKTPELLGVLPPGTPGIAPRPHQGPLGGPLDPTLLCLAHWTLVSLTFFHGWCSFKNDGQLKNPS